MSWSMEKAVVSVAMLLLGTAASGVKHTVADVGPSEPDCPTEWGSNPYDSSASCKVISRTISLVPTKKFEDEFSFMVFYYSNQGLECSIGDAYKEYELLPDVGAGNPIFLPDGGRTKKKLIAIRKTFLQKNGGMDGVFKTRNFPFPEDEKYCAPKPIMEPRDTVAFGANSYDVTIPSYDRNDATWWGVTLQPSDDQYQDFSLFPVLTGYDSSPYLLVPANSPVVSREFVYSPKWLDCDIMSADGKGSMCDIVLYKSKEVWMLDNGERQEYPFPVHGNVDGNDKTTVLYDENIDAQARQKKEVFMAEQRVPSAEQLVSAATASASQGKAQLQPAQAGEKSVWGWFMCFFKYLFLAKC